MTEPSKHSLKIEQSCAMRFGQHAQCTCNQQMPAFGLGAAGLLINQKASGVEGKREGYGRAFAGIEKLERRL